MQKNKPDVTIHQNKIKIPLALQHLQKCAYPTSYATTEITFTQITITKIKPDNKTVKSLTHSFFQSAMVPTLVENL